MSSVAIRRKAALDALASVISGSRARDVETEAVDFKEEAGTVVKGQRRSIPARHVKAAEALANEVACFANTTDGGVLVVGVADDEAGLDALVGTYLDLDWLKERVWSLTAPHYAGFFIEERIKHGARLYLIVVEPAAKNHSVIHRAGTATLSPLYDVSPTMAFLPEQHTASLRIDGKSRMDGITRGHLVREAVAWGMPGPIASRTVEETLARLRGGMDDADVRYPDLRADVRDHVRRTFERLARSATD